MRYDLRTLARAGGIRRRALTLRPIDPTRALADPLAAAGRDVVAAIEAGVNGALLPAYAPRPALTQDDAADRISEALSRTGTFLRGLALSVGPNIRRWAVRVEEWHRQKFSSAVDAGTGADVVAFLHGADAGDQVRASVAWATSLIQGLTDDLRKEVESLVWAAYANGTPRDELATQLMERLRIGRTRAEFIARDQTTKLAANLDRLRQNEAGFDEYKWRHSGKAHPRPEHVARDGRVFRWDRPPPGGHPGTEPNCGCRAMAYLRMAD